MSFTQKTNNESGRSCQKPLLSSSHMQLNNSSFLLEMAHFHYIMIQRLDMFIITTHACLLNIAILEYLHCNCIKILPQGSPFIIPTALHIGIMPTHSNFLDTGLRIIEKILLKEKHVKG